MHNAFFLKVQIHFIPAHCGAQGFCTTCLVKEEKHCSLQD